MNVLCSGELFAEPIPTEQCLECALSREGTQPCGYGYRLLKRMFATQENRRAEIHVTDITGCLRKAYYDKIDGKTPYVHEILGLFIGIAIHEAVEVNDEHVTSEIPVTKYGLIGRMDAEYASDNRIEDVKSTRWMKVDKLPYGSHTDQVNIYRILRGNGAQRMQIQMIDMSGPSKCRGCNIPYRMTGGIMTCPSCGGENPTAHLGAYLVEIPLQNDDDISDSVISRVGNLQEAIDAGEPPSPEPSYLCQYCPFVQCYKHPLY